MAREYGLDPYGIIARGNSMYGGGYGNSGGVSIGGTGFGTIGPRFDTGAGYFGVGLSPNMLSARLKQNFAEGGYADGGPANRFGSNNNPARRDGDKIRDLGNKYEIRDPRKNQPTLPTSPFPPRDIGIGVNPTQPGFPLTPRDTGFGTPTTLGPKTPLAPLNPYDPFGTPTRDFGWGSYGFDQNLLNYLNRQAMMSATDAAPYWNYDPTTQTFTGRTFGPPGQNTITRSLADMQNTANQYYTPFSMEGYGQDWSNYGFDQNLMNLINQQVQAPAGMGLAGIGRGLPSLYYNPTTQTFINRYGETAPTYMGEAGVRTLADMQNMATRFANPPTLDPSMYPPQQYVGIGQLAGQPTQSGSINQLGLLGGAAAGILGGVAPTQQPINGMPQAYNDYLAQQNQQLPTQPQVAPAPQAMPQQQPVAQPQQPMQDMRGSNQPKPSRFNMQPSDGSSMFGPKQNAVQGMQQQFNNQQGNQQGNQQNNQQQASPYAVQSGGGQNPMANMPLGMANGGFAVKRY